MKSPADMKICLIDITNACINQCSNCTRFCGNHKKTFFMDFETFKKSVDSYKGYKGYVALIGGEPTLHPEFERFLEYLREAMPEQKYFRPFAMPVKDFYHYTRTLVYERSRKRLIFTSLGPGYYKNFEAIQDTFPFQLHNDHSNDAEHQAIMVTRKELGFTDEEWIKLRDNCWLNKLWSASITPKGAFFCEIAASLDTLFNGPGGWPIEQGWWKRKPEDFKEQLKWCELCSMALPVPMIHASASKDIISPVMYEKLKAVGSQKVAEGRYVLLDPAKYRKEDFMGNEPDRSEEHRDWYIPEEDRARARVAPTNKSLFPKKIQIFIADGSTVGNAEGKFEFITAEEFKTLAFKDWVAVFKTASDFNADFLKSLGECIINPGCLYFYTPNIFRRLSVKSSSILKHSRIIVLNRRAKALRGKESLTFDETLAAPYEKCKRYAFTHYPQVGEIGVYEWLMIMKSIFINRSAFLNPFKGKY